MPYIRQVKEHPTEARRQKLDPHIKTITDAIIASGSETKDALAAYIHIFSEEWAALFTKRQGKVRYYNFNDQGGVIICAMWEMMRRMHIHADILAASSLNAIDRNIPNKEFITNTVALFDVDRGEAVGEFNYTISEITLGLINKGALTKEDAVNALYRGGHTFYDGQPGAYEDASIIDPEKGDTNGYLTYLGK